MLPKPKGDQTARHDWVTPHSALPFDCMLPRLNGSHTARHKQVSPQSASPFESIIEVLVEIVFWLLADPVG